MFLARESVTITRWTFCYKKGRQIGAGRGMKPALRRPTFPTSPSVPESWLGPTPSFPDASLHELGPGGAGEVHSDALRRSRALSKLQTHLHVATVTVQDVIRQSIRLLGREVTAHLNLTQAEASISTLLSTLSIHTSRALEQAIVFEQDKKAELNRRLAAGQDNDAPR